MNSYSNRLITQSSVFLPSFNNQTVIESRSTYNVSLRSSMFKKNTFVQSQYSKRIEKERIREENIRLVTKIAAIKRSRSRLATTPSSVSLHKPQNSERKRQVKLQNLRLGKSIMKIKLGNALTKMKTEGNSEGNREKTKKNKRKGNRTKLTQEYNLFQMEGEVQQYQGLKKRIIKLATQQPKKHTEETEK